METYIVKVDQNGNRFWYQNDKVSRLDGPAIEWANGTREWYLNGQRHRVDGPAIEWAEGTRIWYLNGQRHRVDGPAIECANGHREWWIEGKQLTEQEFLAKTKNNSCTDKIVTIDGVQYRLTAI